MKIAIVGAINHDTIYTFKGEKKTGLGGILYNAVAFANMFGKQDVIYPVSKVGKDHYKIIKKMFAKNKNVNLKGLKINPRGTNENILQYVTEDRRDEILKDNIKTIDFNQVKPFLGSDVIIFNFISGFEITKELISKVRKNSDALLFMDIHNKVFGMDKEGKRYPADFKGWKEWIKLVDVVQANERECSLIAGKELTTQKDFVNLAKKFLALGPKVVLITLGPKGAISVFKQNKKCHFYFCPPSPVEKMVDTTGCGDAFSAGFVFGYMKWRNPVKANAFANVVASINCEDAGLNGFKKLKKADKKFKKVFSGLLKKIENGYQGNLC